MSRFGSTRMYSDRLERDFRGKRGLNNSGPPSDPSGPTDPTCYDIDQLCIPCGNNASCDWVNEGCQLLEDEDLLAINISLPYSEEVCQGSNETDAAKGKIILDNVIGETIELKHIGSYVGGEPCEWKIETNSNKTVTIYVSRSDKNTESIAIQYTANETVTNLTNRDLTVCGGTGMNTSFSGATDILIRTKAHRLQTEYDILIEQQGTDYGTPNVLTNNKNLVRLVAICLILILIILVLSIAAFALCKKSLALSKSKKDKSEEKLVKIAKENALEVDKVMENMRSGAYEDISSQSQSRLCIICNSNFRAREECHLTNECLHLFHTSCLSRWYRMIAKTRELSCPECNTKNHEVTARSMINHFGGVQFNDDIISDIDFQQKNISSIILEEEKNEMHY
ncbi:unnamed protein product [Moneuplotes crassus]|uniref:RING-type domain-containing protein n=1 Tax=Euplotes crassus TaxID=5936 RepID=A0AAD1UMA5_EUPCR|nr:unnamed protein product [Moneuplotes crassus]